MVKEDKTLEIVAAFEFDCPGTRPLMHLQNTPALVIVANNGVSKVSCLRGRFEPGTCSSSVYESREFGFCPYSKGPEDYLKKD